MVFYSCRFFERKSEKSSLKKISLTERKFFITCAVFKSSFFSLNSNFFSDMCFAQLSKLEIKSLEAFLTILSNKFYTFVVIICG